MINLKNIDKFYDSKFQRTFVLKGIDLKIEQGEFISVMGPSGSGKSTMLNIIGLLDAPSAGELFIYDKSVLELKEKKKVDYHRNFMGFIFQAYHLIEEMTVYENIETPLIYKGVKSKERKAMVADLLDRFNMVAKKDLFPQQLSGGQQQLVGIARAIVGKPKLLLADEPTGNLQSGNVSGQFKPASSMINTSLQKMYGFLSVVSIFLSVIALYTLISQTIIRRTKEIGIRKVVGSTSVHINIIIGKSYLFMLLMAAVVGGVGGYYLNSMFLDVIFKFHTPITVFSIILPVICVFVLSLLLCQ